VTIPYEFLPSPAAGQKGFGLDRAGKTVCESEVVEFRQVPSFDRTGLLTVSVPSEAAMRVRFWKEAAV